MIKDNKKVKNRKYYLMFLCIYRFLIIKNLGQTIMINGELSELITGIMENIMLEIMFEVHSLDNIDTCIITDEVIKKNGKPIYKLLRKSA